MKKRKEVRSINHRIRTALFVPFICFLIFSSVLTVIFRNTSLQDVQERYLYEDRLLAQTAEEEIRNVQDCTNMIIIHLNELLTDDLLDENHCPLPNAKSQTIIGKCMLDAFTTFSNLNQILIVWNNGAVFYENWQTNFFLSKDNHGLPEKLSDMGLTRFGTWFSSDEIDSYISGEGPLFAKSYIHIETGDQTGYVILKASPIFAALDEAEENRQLFLQNDAGVLIKGTAVKVPEEPGNSFVNTTQLKNRWVISSYTDMSQDNSRLNQMVIGVLLLSIFLLFMVYQLTHHLILRILRPIKELSDHIASIPDRLPEPVRIETEENEVGVLVTRFNEMAGRNQELVSLLVEEKKRQEQLKLSLLQAQIKPHFLYNTLDTIYCLSEMGKNEEASRTTILLSDYYRHVLSHGLDWVPLSDEVRQTEDYLAIQSIRYHDVLEYSVVMDEECAETMVPKLTLQPLVENAIYHGIKPMGRKGRLILSVHRVEDNVEIRVIDDGQGMSQEQFETIISQAKSSEASFGLRSVYERLSLYYSDQFSMSVEAPENEQDSGGTCLLIILPVKEAE